MSKGLKILLVEDNHDHAELITRSVQKSNPSTRVKHAINRRKCLDLLEKASFDIILLDYYLSDVSGVELLSEIVRLYPRIPVIVVTGQGDERTAAKSIKAGAEEYIVKNRESLENLPKIINGTIHKHKRKMSAAEKKKAAVKPKKDPRLLSGLFKEIEQISFSLKSLYQELNGNGARPASSHPKKKLKKLPVLQKQVFGLKSVMKKLFGGGE